MSCAGCEAKDDEIRFLRSQIVEMQDRLLALTNPASFQIYKGLPVSGGPTVPGVGAEQTFPDPTTGELMMFVGGQVVKAAEYSKAMGKLEEQMSGRSPGDGEQGLL